VAPVAPSVQIAEHELVLQAKRDRGRAVCDLARQKLQRTPRRLMVVENSGAGKEPVLAAVRVDDEMRVCLRDAVRRHRLERRLLCLRSFAWLTEDLAGRSLVEANGGIDGADRFQQ